MSSRPFMFAPAAARFISRPRRDRAKSATAPAAREAGADFSTQILRLAPAGPLEDGPGRAFIDAVRGRALAARPPVTTVVLDLSAVEILDRSWCAVLVALDDSLRASGTRLLLAGVRDCLLRELEKAGVCHGIGTDAIHSSLRSALLAIHAAIPGPGLVTPQVRAWLERCTEDAGSPAE
jgi:anti-anti-sigma regulatory factor